MPSPLVVADYHDLVIKASLDSIYKASKLSALSIIINQLNYSTPEEFTAAILDVIAAQYSQSLESVLYVGYRTTVDISTVVPEPSYDAVVRVDKRMSHTTNTLGFRNVELCLLMSETELHGLYQPHITGDSIRLLLLQLSTQRHTTHHLAKLFGQMMLYVTDSSQSSPTQSKFAALAMDYMTEQLVAVFADPVKTMHLSHMLQSVHGDVRSLSLPCNAYTLCGLQIVNTAQITLLNTVCVPMFTNHADDDNEAICGGHVPFTDCDYAHHVSNMTRMCAITHLYPLQVPAAIIQDVSGDELAMCAPVNISSPPKSSKSILAVRHIEKCTSSNPIIKPLITKLLDVFGLPRGVINKDTTLMVFQDMVRVKIVGASIALAVIDRPDIYNNKSNQIFDRVSHITYNNKPMLALHLITPADVIAVVDLFNFDALSQ